MGVLALNADQNGAFAHEATTSPILIGGETVIRIVCKLAGLCPDGSNTSNKLKTFDIDAPELEAWLASGGTYEDRSVIGAEALQSLPSEAK